MRKQLKWQITGITKSTFNNGEGYELVSKMNLGVFGMKSIPGVDSILVRKPNKKNPAADVEDLVNALNRGYQAYIKEVNDYFFAKINGNEVALVINNDLLLYKDGKLVGAGPKK